MPDQGKHAQGTACAAMPLTICSKCRQTFATPGLWLEHAKQCNPTRHRQVSMHMQHLPTYYTATEPTQEAHHANHAG